MTRLSDALGSLFVMQAAAGVSEIASSWPPVEADSRDAHRTANLRSSPTFPVQAKLSVEIPILMRARLASSGKRRRELASESPCDVQKSGVPS